MIFFYLRDQVVYWHREPRTYSWRVGYRHGWTHTVHRYYHKRTHYKDFAYSLIQRRRIR